MSREEISRTLLSQFYAEKHGHFRAVDDFIAREKRRPKEVSRCKTVRESLKWRRDVTQEISKMIELLQDRRSLTDEQLLLVNEDINMLMKQKREWEVHIRNLGGPNLLLKEEEASVAAAPFTVNGTIYFGVTRDLPQVQALFVERDAERESMRRAQAKEQQAMQERAARVGFGHLADTSDSTTFSQQSVVPIPTSMDDYYLGIGVELHTEWLQQEEAVATHAKDEAAQLLRDTLQKKKEAQGASRMDDGDERIDRASHSSSGDAAGGQGAEDSDDEDDMEDLFGENGLITAHYAAGPGGASLEEKLLQAKKQALLDRFVSAGVRAELK